MGNYVVELHIVSNQRGQELGGDSKQGFNRSYEGCQNKYFESVSKPCVSGLIQFLTIWYYQQQERSNFKSVLIAFQDFLVITQNRIQSSATHKTGLVSHSEVPFRGISNNIPYFCNTVKMLNVHPCRITVWQMLSLSSYIFALKQQATVQV